MGGHIEMPVMPCDSLHEKSVSALMAIEYDHIKVYQHYFALLLVSFGFHLT